MSHCWRLCLTCCRSPTTNRSASPQHFSRFRAAKQPHRGPFRRHPAAAGGGIALVLLTRDYLRSSYCLSELRAFLQLDALRRNPCTSDEVISIIVVSLEPDVRTPQGVTSSVDILIAEVRRMGHDPDLGPIVQGLTDFVFNKIDLESTTEDTAYQVCAGVLNEWK